MEEYAPATVGEINARVIKTTTIDFLMETSESLRDFMPMIPTEEIATRTRNTTIPIMRLFSSAGDKLAIGKAIRNEQQKAMIIKVLSLSTFDLM